MPDFVTGIINWFVASWEALPALVQYLVTVTFKILVVTIGVILIVAFSTYFERKVIGSIQSRVGPNRVGPLGLGQPFADVIKLLIKEVIIPSQSNKFLFVIAPLLTLIPALATWAVIPMNDWFVIADINAGLLYVLALTSLGVYGVILAGWATNSKYACKNALRNWRRPTKSCKVKSPSADVLRPTCNTPKKRPRRPIWPNPSFWPT